MSVLAIVRYAKKGAIFELLINMAKLPKILFIPIVLIFTFLILVAAHKKDVAGKSIKTIVIDAGHGGHDPGCKGGSEFEKIVTLKVALALGKYLEDSLKDVKIIYTRKTDKFIELSERSNIANKNNADLFLSIHCNANDNTSAKGSETYIMGLHKNEGNLAVSKRENAAIMLEENYKSNTAYGGFDPNSPIGHIIFSMLQNAYLEQSAALAGRIEKEFKDSGKLESRGVKQAGFLVLWKTSMPSLLVEIGFLTNSNDRLELASEIGQKRIAASLYRAIKSRKQELEKVSAEDSAKTN